MLIDRRIVLLIVGLALMSVGGLWSFRQHVEPISPAAAPVIEKKNEMLIAKQALEPGILLTADKVEWVFRDGSTSQPAAIMREQGTDGENPFLGRIIVKTISKGDALLADHFATGNTTNYIAQQLQPGKRAYAISIDTKGTVTAGNFILPNDHVDIIRSYNSNMGLQSETILTNIRVLAVGQTVHGEGLSTAGDTQGSWTIGDFTFANATGFATTRSPTATFAPGIKTSDGSGTATLKALERAGYLKTLAEPTLTAISGESAKFTAGGEIPVPTGDICSTNAAGLQSCQTSYGYKPIGVTLSFTPIVLTAGRINLRVSTEVTEIDPDNGSRSNSGNIPAFRSRKMETTVELASGAALMSAGLIQHQSSATYDRVPGIAAVPVLGQLFQSNDYQNHQTELLISVVPYIAKPFGAMEPNASEQEFLTPSDTQTKLTRELNALYGLRARSSPAKFGFEIP